MNFPAPRRPQYATSSIAIAISFATAILFLVASADQVCAQSIYWNDFDQHTYSHKMKVAEWAAEWNEPEWEDGVAEGRVRIEHSSKAYGGSGSCLAIKFPPGKYGTKNTGAQWRMELPDSYEHVFLTYHMKFKSGFDFVKGGKLPGLAGGTTPTGTTAATGYNGWTGRMMWRTDHTGNPGSPKQKRSNLMSYAKYYQSGYDNDGKDEDETYFGDNINDRIEIKANVWYKVTQQINLNDHWASNGELRIWLDDELVVDKTDVRFRKTANLGIDYFYFSAFFGGGYSWRTSKWETMYFDNFSIYVVE